MSSGPLFPTSLLDSVRDGMTVIDEQGRRLGKVVRVHMGDPQAVTADTEPDQNGPEAAVFALANPGGTGAFEQAVPLVDFDQEDLPEEVSEELRRAGYIEVDGPALHGIARYVSGDHLVEVTGETVRVRPAPHLPPARATG